MLLVAILAALVLAYVARAVLAARARTAFCGGDCVTLALRLRPGKRGLGWKHGYARRDGDRVYWRAEHKVKPGADLTFDRLGMVLQEHRPVVKGEAMLSERCELVFVRYQGEPIELGVPQDELGRVLDWMG